MTSDADLEFVTRLVIQIAEYKGFMGEVIDMKTGEPREEDRTSTTCRVEAIRALEKLLSDIR